MKRIITALLICLLAGSAWGGLTGPSRLGSMTGVLATDITSIGSDERVLLIQNDQSLSSNITVPANVTLKFMHGSVLTCTGYTLTVNGPIEAGPYQIFTAASGEVVFGVGSQERILPEWCGTATQPARLVPGFTARLAERRGRGWGWRT